MHYLIYAISTQIDSVQGRENFLFRWPGNDYVDFLGMDSYHGLSPVVLTTNMNTLSRLSKELKKPCGVTETGVEGIQRGEKLLDTANPYPCYGTVCQHDCDVEKQI